MKQSRFFFLFIFFMFSINLLSQDSRNRSTLRLGSRIRFYYNLFISLDESSTVVDKIFALEGYYRLLNKEKLRLSLDEHDLLNSRVLNDRSLGMVFKNMAVKFYLDTYKNKNRDILLNKDLIYHYIDFTFRILEIDSKMFPYLDDENKARIKLVVDDAKDFLKESYKKDIDINSKFVVLSFIVVDDLHFTRKEQQIAIFVFNHFTKKAKPDLYLEDFFMKILGTQDLYEKLDPDTFNVLPEDSRLDVLFYTIVNINNPIAVRANALKKLKDIDDMYKVEVLSFSAQLSIMVASFEDKELLDLCWFKDNFFYDKYEGTQEDFLFTENQLAILKGTLLNIKNYDILVSIKVLKFFNNLSFYAYNFSFSEKEYRNLLAYLSELLISGDIRLNSLNNPADIDNIDDIRAKNRELFIEYLKSLVLFIKMLNLETPSVNVKQEAKENILALLKEITQDEKFLDIDRDLTKESLYILFNIFDDYSKADQNTINAAIERLLSLPPQSVSKMGYGACTKSFYRVISSLFLI